MSQNNLVGQRLNQYEFRDLLGEGGMGQVYHAYDSKIKRDVAIKIILPQWVNDEKLVKRFIREARTCANLEHPNIVKVYDFGNQDDKTYVVMQFLTGGALSDRLKKFANEGMPIADVILLIKQISSALDYAHRERVIHRDIKPANIMFDTHGQAYVVDFGIAKVAQDVQDLTLTKTGAAIGTFYYMPPEQWRGDELTAKADQYALAVMTYQLLCGRLPFIADSPVAIMQKHINEYPTPLSKVRRDIAVDVDMVMNRALAKNPQERFNTCSEFANALERAIYFKSASKLRPKLQIPIALSVALFAIILLVVVLSSGGGDENADNEAVIVSNRTIETNTLVIVTATSTDIPTATPSDTPTITPSNISTPSDTPTVTPSNTSTTTSTPSDTPTVTTTPTPSIIPTATALAGYLGGANITSNEQWTPIEQEFDGVPMVFVPIGCFMMGSDVGDNDEKPVHEQCFDEPFWIDTYEVTQAQFARLNGQKANLNQFVGDDLPVDSITWFEARDFCMLRGGRLPTEAEWEYVARGPNNFAYPWGNDFVADNVVYSDNSDSRTAPVGSREGGVSWVGAMDMSGNVWEWVGSLYEPYPYDADHERENADNQRVLRGGAWLDIDIFVRSTYRDRSIPTGEGDIIGFRCVISQ